MLYVLPIFGILPYLWRQGLTLGEGRDSLPHIFLGRGFSGFAMINDPAVDCQSSDCRLSTSFYSISGVWCAVSGVRAGTLVVGLSKSPVSKLYKIRIQYKISRGLLQYSRRHDELSNARTAVTLHFPSECYAGTQPAGSG